jgi:uncharacterized protein
VLSTWGETLGGLPGLELTDGAHVWREIAAMTPTQLRKDLTHPADSVPMRMTSAEDLRSVYRTPGGGAIDKAIQHLDQHCIDYLAKSPFFVLSTANADGTCDGSPKGGHPGFVQALDEHRLAWADLAGNNRLDSFENLVTNDGVALLFLIPGMDETLRVNGRAELTTDPELCQRLAIDGKPARAAVVVTVAEAYVHCAKAFRRSALWSTETWLDPSDRPNAACMLKDHAAIDVDASVIEDALDRDAETTLWEPGGRA